MQDCLVDIGLENSSNLVFKSLEESSTALQTSFALHQSLYAAWVRLRCISSRSKIGTLYKLE